jgi:hypothetical protein
MPKKPKPLQDLTTEEAIRKLFPKEVVEEAKKEANPDSKASTKDKPK